MNRKEEIELIANTKLQIFKEVGIKTTDNCYNCKHSYDWYGILETGYCKLLEKLCYELIENKEIKPFKIEVSNTMICEKWEK